MANSLDSAPVVPELLAAIGAQGPVAYVRAAGSLVAVKRWGAGRPVICLHATGHGAGDYTSFAERVSDRFEVIAIDWPGQGRSPPDGASPRAGHYADIVVGVCSELGLERPIVIGNSIGGAAALIAAHRSPERFSGLVLCNPGGLSAPGRMAAWVIKQMETLFSAGARNAPWFDAAFNFYYGRVVLPRAPAEAQRRRIVSAGRLLAPLLADAWRGFAAVDADLRNLPIDVTMPVWLAWAKSDLLVSWDRSRTAAQQFPDHSVTLFRGGHAPFLEDPDSFALGFEAFATLVWSRSQAIRS